MKFPCRLIQLLLLLLIPLCSVVAEDSTTTSEEQATEHLEEDRKDKKLSSLETIAKSIARNKELLKEKQSLLRSSAGRGREEEIQAEIKTHADDIAQLEQNFRQIASGVDLSLLDSDEEQVEFNLSTEIGNLLKPLLSELQELTENPRQIDSITSYIQNLSKQMKLLKRAMEQADTLDENIDKKSAAHQLLLEAKSHWKLRYDELKTEIEIQDQKLKQRLENKVPLSESLENVFEVFFKTRGRNFLLALVFSFLFYFSLKKIYEIVQNTPTFSTKSHSNANRLLVLGFILASSIGSTIVFVATLYFTGDWLLLTVALLLLVGLAWGSREALPKFWSQIALLLNMGPVREGERLIYNGVAWKVDKIHLYCRLVNPLLAGGKLRLPIADITSLRSRRFSSDEGYFPTREGDWVLLPSDSIARVVLQSPEIVQLVELGGAKHTYSTTAFLQLGAVCLSRGFRVYISFGIDYQHQDVCTSEVPKKMLEFICQRLEHYKPELGEASIRVEFEAAGASSLNFAITADVDGEFAKDYFALRRLLQKCAVEACNEFDWVIPFEQLTMHLAEQPLKIANS